jgi:hypothetical protein
MNPVASSGATRMSLVTFDSQAAALVKDFQRQAGMLAAPVEQALAQVQQADPAKPLTLQQVEQVLLSAMPEQKSVIQGSCQRAACYHPDNKNPRFLTQILSMKIEKESDFVVRPNPVNAPPVRRDPLYATFTMDPKADFMLLFNARDVDKNGQPLLMKVVARERADITKLDLTRYRMQDPTKPDVVKIANDQSYVETKDVHETEFQFGDPLKQVSVGNDGKELSTSVWVRPENVNKEFAFNGMWDNPNAPANARRIVPNRARRRRRDDDDSSAARPGHRRERVREPDAGRSSAQAHRCLRVVVRARRRHRRGRRRVERPRRRHHREGQHGREHDQARRRARRRRRE